MRVLIIDNFDSFTYNLVQYLGALGAQPKVFRNNAITPDRIVDQNPDRILISPGPGDPNDAGISREVIKSAQRHRIPLLGVCLGHQCLADVFGSRIIRAMPMHGKTSIVEHDGKGVFTGIQSPMEVARYHSLVVDPNTLGDQLKVSARTTDGIIMGLRHMDAPLEGIQFHPESFMTPSGMSIVENFLQNGDSR